MTRAGAEIENRARRDLQFVEPAEQLVAHALLQRRGGVVTGAGAVEGARHGAAIEREESGADPGKFMRPAPARARSPAHPPALLRAVAEKVTRSRAVPGRHRRRANRRDEKTLLLRARCSPPARAPASPRTTGTMWWCRGMPADCACASMPRSTQSALETPRKRQRLFAPPGLAITDAQRRARRRGHRRRQAPWCRCRCAISASGSR